MKDAVFAVVPQRGAEVTGNLANWLQIALYEAPGRRRRCRRRANIDAALARLGDGRRRAGGCRRSCRCRGVAPRFSGSITKRRSSQPHALHDVSGDILARVKRRAESARHYQGAAAYRIRRRVVSRDEWLEHSVTWGREWGRQPSGGWQVGRGRYSGHIGSGQVRTPAENGRPDGGANVGWVSIVVEVRRHGVPRVQLARPASA